LSDLKDVIVMAHIGIAAITGSEVWKLDDREGENLAGAVQKVARHYNIPDVASETKDWIALIIMASTIYGPRFAARWAENNTPPAPPARQDQDNVINIVNAVPGLTQ
jgi:hypothetical protein